MFSHDDTQKDLLNSKKLVNINPWTENFVNAMSGVSRSCQEIPDLSYKNDGKSMLVYDFFNFSDKKFGEKDWTKSNETLDLLGVNSEVYTAKGLWTIKSRGFGIRTKFTDLSENQDDDRLIFEYVIRDKKENWGDFTNGIFEEGSEIFEAD